MILADVGAIDRFSLYMQRDRCVCEYNGSRDDLSKQCVYLLDYIAMGVEGVSG